MDRDYDDSAENITVEIEGREQSDFWFACVDLDVIRDKVLSPCDKAVYVAICARVNTKSRSCALKVRTIAADANCGLRTAQESIKALVARGVLERRNRFANSKQLSCSYRIIGHRAICYQTASSAIGEEDSGGADFAPPADSAPIGVQKTTPRVLEPEPYEIKEKESPLAPQGEGELESQKSEKPDLRAVIVELYNSTLPELPKAMKLTDQRKRAIRARIRDDPERKNDSWWREFFARIRDYPWLMGENPDSKGWKADFDWLMKPANMQKVLEGRYPVRSGATGRTATAEAVQRQYTQEGGGTVDARALLRNTP